MTQRKNSMIKKAGIVMTLYLIISAISTTINQFLIYFYNNYYYSDLDYVELDDIFTSSYFSILFNSLIFYIPIVLYCFKFYKNPKYKILCVITFAVEAIGNFISIFNYINYSYNLNFSEFMLPILRIVFFTILIICLFIKNKKLNIAGTVILSAVSLIIIINIFSTISYISTQANNLGENISDKVLLEIISSIISIPSTLLFIVFLILFWIYTTKHLVITKNHTKTELEITEVKLFDLKYKFENNEISEEEYITQKAEILQRLK